MTDETKKKYISTTEDWSQISNYSFFKRKYKNVILLFVTVVLEGKCLFVGHLLL